MSAAIEKSSICLKREERVEYSTRLWILIEYYMVIGSNKTKCYEVVDAKDAYAGRGNSALEMTTGKLIYVQREKTRIEATIVTISDDKKFLDTELQDLLELQRIEQGQQIAKKRKRTATPKTEPLASNQYQRWNNREPSLPPPQSVIISNPNVQSCPPMTFDQQTQTDFKQSAGEFNPLDARLSKILMNEENIIRSQHSIALENQELKQTVSGLGAQLSDMKSMLQEVLAKLDGFADRSKGDNGNDTSANNSVLNFSQNGTPKILNQAPRILNLSQQSLTPQQTYYNTISIESVEASNDSFSLSNNSRRSFSTSNQSIYHPEINRSTTSLNNSEHAIANAEPKDMSRCADSFTDDDGNASDEVVIGNNQTTVKRSVLMNVNWGSHTNATRKLLTAKFSRDVLATHSLTGKPSPGKFTRRALHITKNSRSPNRSVHGLLQAHEAPARRQDNRRHRPVRLEAVRRD